MVDAPLLLKDNTLSMAHCDAVNVGRPSHHPLFDLREGANVDDIPVNLIDKQHRVRKSHGIALAIRLPNKTFARKYSCNAKIVEVPPVPPVPSPIVAEIYGLDYAGQIREAKKIRQLFANTVDIIDIDDSIEFPATKFTVKVDRQKAALLGLARLLLLQYLGRF